MDFDIFKTNLYSSGNIFRDKKPYPKGVTNRLIYRHNPSNIPLRCLYLICSWLNCNSIRIRLISVDRGHSVRMVTQFWRLILPPRFCLLVISSTVTLPACSPDLERRGTLIRAPAKWDNLQVTRQHNWWRGKSLCFSCFKNQINQSPCWFLRQTGVGKEKKIRRETKQLGRKSSLDF